jgi:Fur family zinc uptake transcriptional regulator
MHACACHPRDVAAVLADAEATCSGRERRLTPMRRRVLEALAASEVPLGAYDIIDRLGRHGVRPAPISVYRALDFLVAEGFVHRLESRNAFIVCTHRHGAGEPVVFLICERCGATAEASSPDLQHAIQAAAAGRDFAARAPVIEVPGLCASCRRP